MEPFIGVEPVDKTTLASYSKLARRYVETTSKYDPYPGLREELTEFISQVPAGPILDLGCGGGRDSRLARSLGHVVVGLDYCIPILHCCRRVSPSASEKPLPLVAADVLALPFTDSRFTAVIANGVLLHPRKRSCPAALGEIARVLRPGGIALFSLRHGNGEGFKTSEEFPEPRWIAYYQVAEFVAMTRRAGFTDVSEDISPHEDWFTISARKPTP